MNKMQQQGCEWTITGREPPIIKYIRARLINCGFTNNQLKPNILINSLIHKEEKHTLVMGKAGGILSKLISNALQLIIKGKTPQEGWNALQERFQHIGVMSTLRIIYKATSKRSYQNSKT